MINIITKFVITTIIALTCFAAHGVNVNEAERMTDSDVIQSDALNKFVAERIEATKLKKMNNRQRLMEKTSEPYIIDVAVLFNQVYLDDMAENITYEKVTGKPYENGAQFAIERTEKRFEYLNETFAMQGVNARLRPVYYAVTENDIINTNDSQDGEIQNLLDCIYFPASTLNYINKKDNVCIPQKLVRLREILNSKVDLIYYVRTSIIGERVGGIAGYMSVSTLYDGYKVKANDYVSFKNTGSNEEALYFTEEQMSSYRFGYQNAGTFTHEIGHNLGGAHNISNEEPETPGVYNRAYACGSRLDGTEKVLGNEESMRKTALFFAGGAFGNDHHRFYSDPEMIVEGDSCGVHGVANNIEYIRKNGPIAAQMFDMPAETSQVSFYNSELSLDRNVGVHNITLTRTGDLTKPAYVSLSAKDGTAWEQRDYKFGLVEVAFLAGESEKTVPLTLMPVTESRAAVNFEIVMKGSVAAKISETPLSITIESDAIPNRGTLSIEDFKVTAGKDAQIVIKRSNGSDDVVAFTVRSSDGTATRYDYLPTVKRVIMQPGQTEAIVSFQTSKMIGSRYGDRTVLITISDAQGAVIEGGQQVATVTIQDEPEYAFDRENIAVIRGDTLSIDILRDGSANEAGTISVSATDITAKLGVDYELMTPTLTFNAGSNKATILVKTIANPANPTSSNQFQLNLSNPSFGTIGYMKSLTVSLIEKPKPVEPVVEKGKSSGGSFGIISLLGLILLGFRKRA